MPGKGGVTDEMVMIVDKAPKFRLVNKLTHAQLKSLIQKIKALPTCKGFEVVTGGEYGPGFPGSVSGTGAEVRGRRIEGLTLYFKINQEFSGKAIVPESLSNKVEDFRREILLKLGTELTKLDLILKDATDYWGYSILDNKPPKGFMFLFKMMPKAQIDYEKEIRAKDVKHIVSLAVREAKKG